MGKSGKKSKSSNARISLKVRMIEIQKRVELVRLVRESGLSIRRAAKQVGIKLSTAKLIVLRFKRTGTYHVRREDRLFEHLRPSDSENSRNGGPIAPTEKAPEI